MSAELDALWNEFAAETEEHLEALERILSDRRGGDWSPDEIAALFRYFHSLKGTFLAMGFGNVEAVAHRCEDVLSLVRDGRSTLDRDLAQILLRAVDRLKGMREDVIATRKDAKAATALLRELDRQASGEPEASAAPAAAAEPAPLSDDPEMLAIYSELLDQRLPQLVPILSRDPQACAGAAESAGELAYGAGMMTFEALAERLQAVAGLADGGDRGHAIVLFCDIREQAKIIEEVTGNPSGAASLAAALAPQLAQDYAEAYKVLQEALARDAAGEAAETDDASEIVQAATALRMLADCLGFAQSARLVLLIEERFRSLGADPVLAAASHQLAAETIDALGLGVDTVADIDAGDADKLVAQWQTSFRAPLSAALVETAAHQGLRQEMLATLSGEQRDHLELALAEGRRAYEVLFELEANPDIAGDLIAWLSSAVETITSRTVYRHGTNCFEFLIFSEHGLDWIKTQLKALDPDQACLHGITELGGAPEAAIETRPGETAPAARAPLIRVRSETIDELMAEVGEMRTSLARLADVIQHGRIAHALEEAHRTGSDVLRQNPELRHQIDAMEADLRELKGLEQGLEAAHRRIWTAGLQLRVIPVEGLFGRLSRAARDLAQKLGKDIDVIIEGREVRVDKSMVDGLIDPLMHMVRNAVDHGVEPRERRMALGKPARARLSISAVEQGNRVDIQISDDGRGLDHSKILDKALKLGLITQQQAEQMPDRDVNALIFQPGFSTADAITEISGRGVGLDVVAATLQRLGGTIDMETWPGAGTRFTLKLPISAALLRALLVEVDQQTFALPERQVVSVLELARNAVEIVSGQPVVLHRGAAVPVHDLGMVLGFDAADDSREFVHIAIVSAGSQVFGLRVDRILRFQDLFLKELHPMLAASSLISGASVLGDGRPVLVLETRGFLGMTVAAGAEPVASA
jgi:two-component system chemotaxis sensor kinase CheA